MTHTRKWWWLVAIVLVTAGLNYSWSVEGRVDQQQIRQTSRVDFSKLTETVVSTGVIRPMVGAEVFMPTNLRKSSQHCNCFVFSDRFQRDFRNRLFLTHHQPTHQRRKQHDGSNHVGQENE